MTSNELRALSARWREGLERRNPLALAASYADNCVLESPAWGTVKGRDAVERVFGEFFAAFPDCHFEFGDLLFVENQVVQTITLHGTDTGGFLGQSPTGKPFRFFLVDLFEVDDQGIVHERRVYDVGGLMLQLGADGGGAEAAHLYKATLERTQTEHELRTAAQIQRSLMPQTVRTGIGFEVVATSRPCRAIGGDFVDYFSLPEGAFAFVLGDVAGKGPPAALLAAVLQGVFTANAYRAGSPAVRIAEANDALVRRGIESRFATAVYAMLTSNGLLTYCNAGHNPPLLIREGCAQRLEAGGMIVGMFEDASFDDQAIQLEPGDVLVAFSDGITEARNVDGDEFGEDRLLTCINAHRELAPAAVLRKLFETVHQFGASAAQSDDLTVLLLSYSGTPAIQPEFQ